MVALAMSHAAMAKDIKVAVVGAMSGPIAQWGDMEFNGARQAIKDINAKGGVKGDKLVAVEYDDACDPKQAVAVANKVVNDGIKYVIGHLCSSSTQPASDIYEDEGILMISPARPIRNSPSAVISTLCVPQGWTPLRGRPPRNISSAR
jgi:branched-chain amino acid transport system substrate-binding protein